MHCAARCRKVVPWLSMDLWKSISLPQSNFSTKLRSFLSKASRRSKWKDQSFLFNKKMYVIFNCTWNVSNEYDSILPNHYFCIPSISYLKYLQTILLREIFIKKSFSLVDVTLINCSDLKVIRANVPVYFNISSTIHNLLQNTGNKCKYWEEMN